MHSFVLLIGSRKVKRRELLLGGNNSTHSLWYNRWSSSVCSAAYATLGTSVVIFIIQILPFYTTGLCRRYPVRSLKHLIGEKWRNLRVSHLEAVAGCAQSAATAQAHAVWKPSASLLCASNKQSSTMIAVTSQSLCTCEKAIHRIKLSTKWWIKVALKFPNFLLTQLCTRGWKCVHRPPEKVRELQQSRKNVNRCTDTVETLVSPLWLGRLTTTPHYWPLHYTTLWCGWTTMSNNEKKKEFPHN